MKRKVLLFVLSIIASTMMLIVMNTKNTYADYPIGGVTITCDHPNTCGYCMLFTARPCPNNPSEMEHVCAWTGAQGDYCYCWMINFCQMFY